MGRPGKLAFRSSTTRPLSSPTADDSSGFLLLATHLEIFVLSLREFSIASTGDVKKVALSPSVHLIV
jgi:hypothetical protein